MTTKLDVDAPDAAAALAECYRLLRIWAHEARTKDAADSSMVCDPGDEPAASAPDETGHGRDVMSLDCAE